MTINRTPLFSANRTTRVWLMPTAALALLAGTSGALAQDSSGFGLAEALNEQASQAGNEYAEPEWDAESTAEDSDLSDLDGAVDVNEYDLVDLHVNSEDLGNILQLLSIQSQRNIISSNEVSASITADLYGVTFYEALDSILHVNGFGYIEKGNFIYVYTREQIEEIVRANRSTVTRVVNLDYLNSTDAAAFATQLLSESGSITTTAATEAFALSDGSPTGADNYASTATLVINDYEENVDGIMALIDELDTKPAMVLIEATILQTSLNEANAFGVDFALINNLNFSDFIGTGGPLGVVNGLIGGAGETVDGTAVDLTDSNGSAFGSTPGATDGPATFKAGIVSGDVAVFLRVLDEVTDVTVVSNPKILTLNRQPARVLVGTRVGYLNTTTTETATTQTVEFLDVGTQLAVRPFVSKNGLIRLELHPEVSSAKLRKVTDNSGASVTIPDEDTTEMTTNVLVHDGETVVLGGLFTETTSSTRRQVPFLGDIPLIGNAFKGYDDGTVRSEIIFLITPSIVNDSALSEAGDMANQYIEQARFGGRKALLPWSRERQVGQLLIAANDLASEGKTELALAKIDRALRLSPMSPDARIMRSQLTNSIETTPSRSILKEAWGEPFFQGMVSQGDSMLDEQVATEIEFESFEIESSDDSEPEFIDFEESETFAEVPVESVSDASDSGSESFEEWTSEQDEIFTEVQTSDAEFAQYESAPVDESFDSEWDAEFAEAPVAFETEPTVEFVPQAPQQFVSTPLYTEVPVEDDFQSTGSDSQQITESTQAANEVIETPASDSHQEIASKPVAADKFSGVLIIPMPGGGALQLDWPMSLSDWSTSTFTSVPTDSALIEEISD